MMASSFNGVMLNAFWSPGPVEMMLLAAVALLLYGGDLPQVARSWGKSLTEFRRGLSGIQNEINDVIYSEPEPERLEYRPESTDPMEPTSDHAKQEDPSGETSNIEAQEIEADDSGSNNSEEYGPEEYGSEDFGSGDYGSEDETAGDASAEDASAGDANAGNANAEDATTGDDPSSSARNTIADPDNS